MKAKPRQNFMRQGWPTKYPRQTVNRICNTFNILAFFQDFQTVVQWINAKS